MLSKTIFKTRLRQRPSYDWVGPFSVRRNRGSWGPRPMRTPKSDSSDSLRGVETSSTRRSQAAQVSLTTRGLYQTIASSLALMISFVFDLCPAPFSYLTLYCPIVNEICGPKQVTHHIFYSVQKIAVVQRKKRVILTLPHRISNPKSLTSLQPTKAFMRLS